MLDNAERPGIDETFISAGNTSNLVMDTREGAPTRAADIMVAAGWSASILGSALMRLHSEFDGSEHRRDMGKTDFLLLMNQLKSFHRVQAMTQHIAQLWRLHDPEWTADAVVWWWLSKVCPVCNGLKFQRVPGTPALSAKHCKACHASGEARLPGGEDGKRLAALLDQAVEMARASIKRRLKNTY